MCCIYGCVHSHTFKTLSEWEVISGCTQTLTVALVLLVQEVALEMDVEFWTSLCCTFEVSEQLTSVIHILQYLMGLPQDKEDGENQRPFTVIKFHGGCCYNPVLLPSSGWESHTK